MKTKLILKTHHLPVLHSSVFPTLVDGENLGVTSDTSLTKEPLRQFI